MEFVITGTEVTDVVRLVMVLKMAVEEHPLLEFSFELVLQVVFLLLGMLG